MSKLRERKEVAKNYGVLCLEGIERTPRCQRVGGFKSDFITTVEPLSHFISLG